MKETYSVDVNCSNCKFTGEVTIPKGIPVDDHKCPTCGCDDLDTKPKITYTSGYLQTEGTEVKIGKITTIPFHPSVYIGDDLRSYRIV